MSAWALIGLSFIVLGVNLMAQSRMLLVPADRRLCGLYWYNFDAQQVVLSSGFNHSFP